MAGKKRMKFAAAFAVVGLAACVASTVKTAAASTLSIAQAVHASSPTSINAGPREGSGGNNVVCGGVYSVAQALRYANGAPDTCGHRDIGAIWRAQGITTAVIRTMHSGTVCSDQGLMSSGRRHGPSPSLDRPRYVDGSTIYLRPLSVWGPDCYAALVGYTEDGRLMAILEGCGNGETSAPVPHQRPATPARHRPKPRYGAISIAKSCEDVTMHQLFGGCPTNTFRFRVSTPGNKQTVVFNPAPGSVSVPAGKCHVGSVVTATEFNTAGWKVISSNGKRAQHLTCTARGVRFSFKNMESPLAVPTAPVTISKSCEDVNLNQLFGGCPTNTFTFVVSPEGGSAISVPYNPRPGTTDIPAGQCVIGKSVTAVEQPISGWQAAPGTSSTQTLPCTPKGARFVFKNMEAPVAAPPTSSPPSQPQPKPQYSCSVGYIVQKDGRTVNVNVVPNSYNGPNGTINWGDGASSPGLSATHTYGADGSWGVSADIRFADGGSAHCAQTVWTRAPTVVPQPPDAPGPNPPDTGGNTTGNPPTDNGGTQCPPGWTPDGKGGCN